MTHNMLTSMTIFAIFLLAPCVSSAFLLGGPSSTVRLPNGGGTVGLYGNGPPVVFSSGLFGLMPRRIYTQLFRELRNDLTLVVSQDVTPVTAALVEDMADALSVDHVGFFAHSSFDADILRSSRVGRAVLCDPVTFPDWTLSGFEATRVDNADPVITVRAENAYEAATSPIPRFLAPSFTGDHDEVCVQNVGHADLLDDPWADMGPRLMPWMRGMSAPRVGFSEWNRVRATSSRTFATARAEYRTRVASLLRTHFVQDTEVIVSEMAMDDGVKGLKDASSEPVAELDSIENEVDGDASHPGLG